ncbi:hypothetical protein C445_15196 [Halobiforma lacisalsi AJ5]|uniref:Rubrerythrin-like domain-containing protein n=1 Tax=Natronobacterium lacisalsi AJ5 TaxID=358396 RepID=M0LC12_NATLA|nr:hypothetical protein C445_15196 [Halobiforma lacisalsi AJ5]
MLFENVNRLLARTTQTAVVYECRRCGTSVDEDTERCPECDAEAIVRHRIS